MVSTSTMSSSRSLAFATARMAVLRGLFCENVSIWNPDSIKETCWQKSYLVCVELAESHCCESGRLHKSELVVESKKEGLLWLDFKEFFVGWTAGLRAFRQEPPLRLGPWSR